LAVGSSVAWVDINMFAPEANRAVVGVAVALDFFSAVLTGEVFYFSLEVFRHWFLRGPTSVGVMQELVAKEYTYLS